MLKIKVYIENKKNIYKRKVKRDPSYVVKIGQIRWDTRNTAIEESVILSVIQECGGRNAKK